MKKLLAFTMLLVLASVIGANAEFFHPMITFENTAQNFTPKAFIANGHFAYYKFGGTATGGFLAIPLEIGFAFDERWSASFVLPLVKTMPNGGGGNFGIDQPWLKGKFIPMIAPNISLGPRIAFRLPLASNTINPIKAMAIDFAGLVHLGYKTAFKLDAQIGMTLELSKTIATVDHKAASPFYFIAEPGYAFNPKMSFNGIIGLSIPVIKGKLGAVDVDGEKMAWVGEKFHWAFSPNVTMNEVFSYKVWSKTGALKGAKDFYFGAGVTANIPI